ncbi:MAG: RNA methyltransferase, partial [Muribaculaceae bacterium]|nr:RNA methyltransferase [Muribaculaceae bacterium]
CRHSERKELKIERLQKIAVSAMKQSLKATLPTIEPMTPISQFIKEQSAIESQKFVCYCSDEITERLVLAEQLQPLRDTTVLIGPEGDFSPEEISATLDSGFKAVTLGDTRLRTETAALYSLSTIHVVNQLSR